MRLHVLPDAGVGVKFFHAKLTLEPALAVRQHVARVLQLGVERGLANRAGKGFFHRFVGMKLAHVFPFFVQQ